MNWLRYSFKKITTRRLFIHWLAPLLLSIITFVLLRPVIYSKFLSYQNLPLTFYLAAGGQVQIGIKEDKGFQQIIYQHREEQCESTKKLFKSTKTECSHKPTDIFFVTKNQQANATPQADAKFLTWMRQLRGGWQVVLHHIPSNQTIPLSLSGNNIEPKISRRNVVWEAVRGNKRQVLFFNGSSVKQLTTNDVSINPSVTSNGKIIFARRDPAGEWETVLHDTTSGKSEIVRRGPDAKHPQLKDGELSFGYVLPGEKPPRVAGAQTFSDNKNPTIAKRQPSQTPTVITTRDIIQELQAKAIIR